MKSFTKEFMVKALKKLLKTKPLNKITVSDIVTECGASKQTFYNHFQDKFELFNFALTTTLKENLERSARESIDYHTTILNYYGRILEEKDFYRSFIRDEVARDLIFRCIFENSYEYFEGLVRGKTGGKQPPKELELCISFNAVGNAELLVDWIRSDMASPPELMAEVNFECIPTPLREFL